MSTKKRRSKKVIGFFSIDTPADPKDGPAHTDNKQRERFHEALLDILENEAPVVEEAEVGSIYVDLSGMEKLYDTPVAFAQRIIDTWSDFLVRRLTPESRLNLANGTNLVKPADRVRVGLGACKFVAHTAALISKPGRPLFITEEESKAFLSDLSVDYIPVSDDLKERLHFFGLGTMGRVARLHPQAIEAQFGPEGRLALDFCMGVDERDVRARRIFKPIGETMIFSAPVSEWPFFWAGVRQLLVSIWGKREREDKTVRRLRVACDIGDETWEKNITLPEPIGELESLQGLLERHLRHHALPGAVTSLTLEITALGPRYAGQESLFSGASGRLKQISRAFAGIKARDGESGLYRVVEVESWSRIPERRYALISFDL